MRKNVNELTHEEFSKKFMASVVEFYEEWRDENEARLPGFEQAIERVKRQGVLPATVWPDA